MIMLMRELNSIDAPYEDFHVARTKSLTFFLVQLNKKQNVSTSDN